MLVIDRFEGEYAVVESSKGMISIPRSDLPAECREGDILRLQIDQNSTTERKKRIEGLMNNLFQDS